MAAPFSFGSSFSSPAARTSSAPTTNSFLFGSVFTTPSTTSSNMSLTTTTTSGTSTTTTTTTNLFNLGSPDFSEKSNRRPNPTLGTKKKVFPVFGKKNDSSDDDEPENSPLFKLPAFHSQLKSQWRNMKWTEERKTELMKSIKSYTPSTEGVSRARVLLLGPVGSGKSSFISSVQSVFNGRVTNRAMVGSLASGFTKKIQSFIINCAKGDRTGLALVDLMGLRDGQMTGLSLHDILSVIKGHVPDGHKFSPDQTIDQQTVGFISRPSLKDRVHCVVFVVAANSLASYPQGLKVTFRQLRQYISDLGVHQVALLTHVDQVCTETSNDISNVYTSANVRLLMDKAAALLGMSPSHIVPVKNYSFELDVDLSTDVLLLSAVDHILQYTDLYFQDNADEESSNSTERYGF